MRTALLILTVATAFVLSGPEGALAQTPSKFDCNDKQDPVFSVYCTTIDRFLTLAAAHKNTSGKIDRTDPQVKRALDTFVTVYSDQTSFTALLANSVAFRDALNAAANSVPPSPTDSPFTRAAISGVNQARPDKQSGAGSNASGTTSLVEKAGTAAILDFALESGALTRSVSGNTATLSGNAEGLWRTLTRREALCFECGDTKGTKILRDINLSAAFLIDQRSSSTTTTSGPANSSTPPVTSVMLPTKTGKLSGFTARYQFWNPYDPHSAAFSKTWKETADAANADIQRASKDLQEVSVKLLAANKLDQDDLFQRVLLSYRDTILDDADAGDLNKLRRDFLALYQTTIDTWAKDDPEFMEKVAAVNLSLAKYKQLWQSLLDKAKGKPLLTLEYAFNRTPDQPETHDVRLVFGYTPKDGSGLLSVNAALSFYGGTIPAGAKYGRLYDGQVSTEYDWPITLSGHPNQATGSLAAYWQYQPHPSVLNITAGNLAPGTNIDLPQNAQVLLGTGGSLWVTQAKFTINGKSGIKIPFAVKWANKTDLLGRSKLGAQVGISYDFSSLSSLFGGSVGQ
jgi:hypothetical protein